MAKLLVIFEKIVLTEGIRLCGKIPATTTASVAAISAYSIISWPSSSRQSLYSSERMFVVFLLPILTPLSGYGNREITVSRWANTLSQIVLRALLRDPVRTDQYVPGLRYHTRDERDVVAAEGV